MNEHVLIEKGDVTLSVVAGGGFSFYVDIGDDCTFICNTSVSEALEIAAGIIYSVWTKNPDAANALVNKLQLHKIYDRIPEAWSERNESN